MTDILDDRNNMMEERVTSLNSIPESLRGENFGTIIGIAVPRQEKGEECVASENEALSQSGASSMGIFQMHTEAGTIQKTYKRKEHGRAYEKDLSQSMLDGGGTCDLHVNVASVLRTAEADSGRGDLVGTSIDGKIGVTSIVENKNVVIDSAVCASDKMCDMPAKTNPPLPEVENINSLHSRRAKRARRGKKKRKNVPTCIAVKQIPVTTLQIASGSINAKDKSLDKVVIIDPARAKISQMSIDDSFDLEKDNVSPAKDVKADSMKGDITPELNSNSQEVPYISQVGNERAGGEGEVCISGLSSPSQENVSASLQTTANCTSSSVSFALKIEDAELGNKNSNTAWDNASSKSADVNILENNGLEANFMSDLKCTKSKHKRCRKKANGKSSDTNTAPCFSLIGTQCGTSNCASTLSVDDGSLTKVSDGISMKENINSPEVDPNISEVENPCLMQTTETKVKADKSSNYLEHRIEELQMNVSDEQLPAAECSKAGSSDEAPALARVQKRTRRKRKNITPEERTSDDALVQKNDGSLVPLLQTKNEKLESLDVLPERSLRCHSKRKLLVLDLNGLLCDVVYDFHSTHAAHKVGNSSVFKRPFCDEFLMFCFERFDIGVWSSRKKYNVDGVVEFVMGVTKQKLLFCWDVSKCTFTGFNTIDNRHKPLVLKELKKLWNKEEADLPWEKGEYMPSNTLLVDDSPYKALRNPPHTAIFPYPYNFNDRKDVSLGPRGNLRVYLEGLATADDVQQYVHDHPFGQRAITARSSSWEYYQQIINKIDNLSNLS